MTTIKNIFLFAIALCLSTSFIQAQEYTEKQTEIIDFIKKLEYTIDHFTGSADIKKFLSFYDDNYKVERMEYSIDGTGRFLDLNYDEFKQNILRAGENEDEEISYNITDINYVQVVGFGATINFNASFALNDNGEKLFSGTRNTTFQLKKTPAGWKIVHAFVTEVRDDIVKYACTYSLFKRSETELVAKVKYPAGTYFQEAYVEFDFRKKNAETKAIYTDKGDIFLWEDGVISIPESTGRSRRIGVAQDRSQAIAEIVQSYYGEVCSTVNAEL